MHRGNTYKRVGVYIDGPNFEGGIEDAGWSSGRWWEPVQLGKTLLRPGQDLVLVALFTAYLPPGPASDRQKVHLAAIEAKADTSLDIVLGRYAKRSQTCHSCHHAQSVYEEKMTDVNLGIRLMVDAFDNRYDIAIVVSADTDLAPAILAVHQRYATKRVIVAMPPGRDNGTLRQAAQGYTHVNKHNLYASQLPDDVITSWGTTHRPHPWKDQAV